MSNYIKDLAERVAATYVESFAGLLIAAETFAAGTINLTGIETAAVAAIPAALSVIKGAAAKRVGKNDTAAVRREKADA